MVTGPEKELINRLLRFANLRKIESTTQVEGLFSNIDGLTGKLMPYLPEEVQTCIDEQAVVKDALMKISTGVKLDLEQATEAVNAKIRDRVRVGVALINSRLTVVSGLLGVEAAAWYGIALMIDESRALRTRLRQCGAPGCGRFFLDVGRKGRPRRHCSERHRRLADAEPSRKRSELRRAMLKRRSRSRGT